MKKLILPVLLAFGVTLAAIIGQRMSTDAMAVVIGVAVGVAASIPTSLLLVAMLRRERPSWHTPDPYSQRQLPAPQQQPIIMVTPPQWTAQTYIPPLPAGRAAGPREIQVIGAEGGWQ